VPIALAPADLRAASERFRGFFDELARAFVEREDLLTQVALALLGREHVLMTGPPGTAKSGVAAAVLGRIVDERTSEPSVFERQFTESTVQTDLVGPIDFKTLMQTGRTEHFTDEGMLGAVHAFLDEVLDGRDMLLRTTLNVLQERELKQGTKTTHGRIECALMTTNRYLAEVLESSRETLLAFVDRVAFVSFVPKGFAGPGSLDRVLRAQVGGTRGRSLKATLTIQDLDLLQAAVDRTIVPDEICTALGQLVGELDAELAAAAKSDPTFLPTRYMSTRTAVRLARLLRAVCVYDAIMNGNARDLLVDSRDVPHLRLSLLLSGPQRDAIAPLLERESDPRERRQLSILRTERDLFERVLSRVKMPERHHVPRSAVDVSKLDASVQKAQGAASAKPLLEAAQSLAEVADAGGEQAAAATNLLATTLSHLADRALRVGVTAGAGPEAQEIDVVRELSQLADGLEKASGTTRPVARWVRGKAIGVLLDAAALSGAFVGEALDDALPVEQTVADVSRQADRALLHLESLLDECRRLRAAGADEPPQQSFDAATATAIARVEDELVEIWDTGFRDAVAAAVTRVGAEELGPLLARFGPALVQIDQFGARLAQLAGKSSPLKTRVVGPRIEPLVEAAFQRITGRDRVALVNQVAKLVADLEASGLKSTIHPAALLRFATTALVRNEKANAAPDDAAPTHDGYRRLRASDQRVSLAFTVVELAMCVAPQKPDATASPATIVASLGGLVAELPPDLRREVSDLDLGRIERALALLEKWWAGLAVQASEAAASGDVSRIGSALALLGTSKFFHLTRDEGALLRFALEIRVAAEVFPEAAEQATRMRARLDKLEADSSRVLNALRRGRADAGWVELLGPAPKQAS
jgi:MoxR-like ATPase